jgi:hypothetical protein
MSDSWRMCHACGHELQMAAGQSLGEALCGWYVLSHIKDKDSFDRLSFCSVSCLTRWSQNQLSAIPDIFRSALDDEVVK